MKFKNLFKKKSPPQNDNTLGFKQVTYLDEDNVQRTALVPIHLKIVNNIMPECSSEYSSPSPLLPKCSSIYTNSSNEPSSSNSFNEPSSSNSSNKPSSSNSFNEPSSSIYTNSSSNSVNDIINTYSEIHSSDVESRRKSSSPSKSSIDSRFSNIFKTKFSDTSS